MVQLTWYTILEPKKGRQRRMMDYRMINVRGHIEVFDSWGQFILSADNESEARCELDAMLED